MTSKKIMAVLAVALLMLCPVIVVCSGSDGDSDFDSKEKSILVKYDSSERSKVGKVFDLDETSIIYSMFSTAVFDKFTLKVIEWKNITDITGKKISATSDREFMDSVTNETYDFKIQLIAKENGAKFSYTSSDVLSGKGIEEFQAFVCQEFKKGDGLEFEGRLGSEALISYEYDFFKNSDGNYLVKDYILDYRYKASQNITVKTIGSDKKWAWEYTENMCLKSDGKYDFGKDIKDVKSGDKMKANPQTTRSNVYASCSMKYDGVSKEAKFDVEKSADGYQSILESYFPKGEVDVRIMTEKERSDRVDVTLSQLHRLREDVTSKDLDTFKKYVTDNGGLASYSVSDIDKEIDKVKSDTSSGSNNTFLIVGIIIAVIVILAILALWYFKFRSKS